jgi:hypothetical protein
MHGDKDTSRNSVSKLIGISNVIKDNKGYLKYCRGDFRDGVRRFDNKK